MQLMIEYARSERIGTITGRVLRERREVGFHVAADPQEPAAAIVTLPLSA